MGKPLSLPAWEPVECTEVLEMMRAAGFAAVLALEIGRPLRGDGSDPIAWWIERGEEYFAEGVADTREEARAQAEAAFRSLLREHADDLRSQAIALHRTADEFMAYAEAAQEASL